MTMRTILAVALVTPLLTVSSMAQNAPRVDQHVYLGGPKSTIPHATRQITTEGDIFAMETRTRPSHVYPGGPKTVVPHGK